LYKEGNLYSYITERGRMKKAVEYSALIAIFFAVLITSCVVDPPEEIEPVLFDQYGRRMINVAIVFSGGNEEQGRALNMDIAQAVINYCEVLVQDQRIPNPPRRRTTGNINSLYMNLPEYMSFDQSAPIENRAKALVFAGYRRVVHKELLKDKPDEATEMTLFGVGRVTEVGGIPNNLIINPGTTTIRFTMVPLVTKVSDSTDSYFRITGPNGYRTEQDNNYGLAPTSIGDVPFFKLPSSTHEDAASPIVATMRIDGIMGPNPYTGLGFTPLPPHPGDDIYIADSKTQNTQFVFGGDPVTLTGRLLSPTTGAFTSSTPASGFQLRMGTYTHVEIPFGITGSPSYPSTGGAPLPPDNWLNGFPYYVDLSGYRVYRVTPSNGTPYHVRVINDLWQEGWALVSIRIVVRMLGAGTGSAGNWDRHDWIIRPGMYYDRPDQGYDKNSMGGGILMRIGDPQHDPDF
jgi:hypothetical protein